MNNNSQPKVLIVILNYGTFDLTLKLIDELKCNLQYDNYSIMVVDNCSPNESAEILEKQSEEKGYIFYANKVNAGYAAGNNIGIRYGIEKGFDYSWILNNDVELHDNTVLAHMVSIAEKDAQIGCVGPMIFSCEGVICPPYIDRLSFWNMTFGIAFEKYKRKRYIKKKRKVYRVHGCCMLLKNRVMQEIDCMDERTFLYGEEDILAERMLAKKYYSYYDSDVGIVHKDKASLKKATKNRKQFQIQESQKSMELYLKEYRKFTWLSRWICKNFRNLIILYSE